jgi:GAF domain-containing protein
MTDQLTGRAQTPGGPDAQARDFLQSVVDVARAIFGAAASSVFLLDEDAGELVFQAVSGEGEKSLVGTRFAAGTGIAGWVAASGEPMVVDDVSAGSPFDRDAAESTGYVPAALMAAPLECGGRVLGVLEVLDPHSQNLSHLSELDLLMLFARQAAGALATMVAARDTAAVELRALLDLVRAMPPQSRVDAGSLLGGLREVLLAAD